MEEPAGLQHHNVPSKQEMCQHCSSVLVPIFSMHLVYRISPREAALLRPDILDQSTVATRKREESEICHGSVRVLTGCGTLFLSPGLHKEVECAA